MTVLIATTTISVRRGVGIVDPYEAAAETIVSTGVAAHIGSPSGSDQNVGGDKELVTAVALLPPGLDIIYSDDLVDERTGERYFVAWVRSRAGLGLDHVKAGLRQVKGGASG